MANILTREDIKKIVSGALKLAKGADCDSNGGHGGWDKEIVGLVAATLVTQALKGSDVKRALLEEK